MVKLRSGNHEFEIVESVPHNYVIWNIGKNMEDGYLPLCEREKESYNINVNTLKAIKLKDAQVILAAIGNGQNTIKKMETYVKKYSKSKNKLTLLRVKRIKKALEIMYTIKFD